MCARRDRDTPKDSSCPAPLQVEGEPGKLDVNHLRGLARVNVSKLTYEGAPPPLPSPRPFPRARPLAAPRLPLAARGPRAARCPLPANGIFPHS